MLHFPVILGQSNIALSANNLIPEQTSNYVAYFAEGQETKDIRNTLPSCQVTQGQVADMEVYKVNTSVPVAYTYIIYVGLNIVSAYWKHSVYPTLNTSLTGLYRCRTKTTISDQTYQLNVRGN